MLQESFTKKIRVNIKSVKRYALCMFYHSTCSWNSQRCLNVEFEEMKPHKTWAGGSVTKCAGELLGYRFDLIGAPEDPDRDIVCTNKPGSCRRSICECDKSLAKSLAKQEETWNPTLHELKGGFDRDQHCHRPTGPSVPFAECCGDTFTFPFNKPRRENQCCSGTEALPEGTCWNFLLPVYK